MKKSILIAAAVMLAGISHGQMFAQMFGVSDTDIQFVSTGHSAGWTPPSITAATLTDAQVTWIAPDGTSTNSKTPVVSFFYPAGTYRIRTADWTKITALSFYAGGASRDYLSAIPNSRVTLGRLTGLTTAFAMFRAQTRSFASISDLPLDKWTLCTSMYLAFFGCTGLTGSIPDLSKMTLCQTMNSAFSNCSGLTGSIPDLSKMTLCTSMDSAFYSCTGLTGNVDVFTGNMTNLTTSANAFYNNKSLSGAGSNFINIAKSPSYTVGTASTNSSYRTFYGCTNLTDWATIPAEYK